MLEAMRGNPLYRALRVDKMTMAALDVVLAEHQAGHAAQSVPVLRMLRADAAAVRARAEAFVSGLQAAAPAFTLTITEGSSAVGGGAAPTVSIPTALVVVGHPTLSPDALAAALRAGNPPIVARVAEDRLVLDLRTVFPEQEGLVRDALAALA
jgi:L-seryl-tRNA(Ser) seleniumtransferase